MQKHIYSIGTAQKIIMMLRWQLLEVIRSTTKKELTRKEMKEGQTNEMRNSPDKLNEQGLYTCILIYIQGGPLKIRKNPLQKCSTYSDASLQCNMSYERKFCGLSGYVQFQNVRPLIKSIDRSKCESAETWTRVTSHNFHRAGHIQSKTAKVFGYWP